MVPANLAAYRLLYIVELPIRHASDAFTATMYYILLLLFPFTEISRKKKIMIAYYYMHTHTDTLKKYYETLFLPD